MVRVRENGRNLRQRPRRRQQVSKYSGARGGQLVNRGGFYEWVPYLRPISRALGVGRPVADAMRGDLFNSVRGVLRNKWAQRAGRAVDPFIPGAAALGERAQAGIDSGSRYLRKIGMGLKVPENFPRITNTGPSKRAKIGGYLPPPPSAIGSQSKMPRRKRTYTSGNHGGRFSNKRVRKVSSALYKGASVKQELNGTFSDSSCVYIGHNSHPIVPTLRMISWSIVRLVAKMWKQDFHSFEERVNAVDASPSCSIRVTFTFRTAYNTPLEDVTFSTSNIKWFELGDNLMEYMIDMVPTACVFFELVRIKFANIDATAVESLQTIVLNAKDLKISVYGKSILKIQNLTVGASGEAEVDAQADDISNNPLRGKIYYGNGQQHLQKLSIDYTAVPNTGALFHGKDNGILTLGANDANMPAENQRILKKPPVHKAFTNFSSNAYIRLAPGCIKNSVVKKSYTKSLHQWMLYMMPVIREAGNSSAISTPTYLKLGVSSVIGLEHELDVGSEPDVKVGYQMDNYMSGVCAYKHRTIACPPLDLGLGTIIIPDA